MSKTKNKIQEWLQYPAIFVSNISMIVSFVLIVVIGVITYLMYEQLPQSTIYIILVSIALLIVIFIVSIWAKYRSKKSLRQEVLETGKSAQALIIRANSTGYGSNSTTAQLTLEVRPSKQDMDGSAPYKVNSSLKIDVDDAKLVFSPGTTIQVFVDPKNAMHVEVPDPDYPDHDQPDSASELVS